MIHNQLQPAPQLTTHPCNNTTVPIKPAFPFSSSPLSSSSMASPQLADYFSAMPSASRPLPSSIILPPPPHSQSLYSAATPHSVPPHSISSFAPPAPHLPAASAVAAADYPASFSLSLHSPHHPALLKLTATSFLPLRAWLPWLEWDGSWVESHPMQTVARCPIGLVSDTVRILHEKGVRQTRHMLLAKF